MHTTNKTAPEAVPLPRMREHFGISRSTVYRLAAAGQIRLIKLGRTTLVDATSVRAFLAAQPTAVIGAGRGEAKQ
ncbi:helix-turn-helix transcriptional regulator [Roseomonas harenae]|uniref:helix-turn-helix transcriptional regulator n=1 Tax=Muricoccus harenae TaxID=2692566 RepID=UPI001915429E|nr:helix-turn-helix domain-containing protein [Roseomonas harenae]